MKRVKFKDLEISDVFQDSLGNKYIKIRECKVKTVAGGEWEIVNAIFWKSFDPQHRDMEGTFNKFCMPDHPVFVDE